MHSSLSETPLPDGPTISRITVASLKMQHMKIPPLFFYLAFYLKSENTVILRIFYVGDHMSYSELYFIIATIYR